MLSDGGHEDNPGGAQEAARSVDCGGGDGAMTTPAATEPEAPRDAPGETVSSAGTEEAILGRPVGEWDDTEAEILMDEVRLLVDMSVHGTVFRAGFHEIINTDWVDSMNRNLGRQDLFVYRHPKAGTFVLAKWLIRPPEPGANGLMSELKVLGKSPPGHGNLPIVDDMTGDHMDNGLPSLELVRKLLRRPEQIWEDHQKTIARLRHAHRAREDMLKQARHDAAARLASTRTIHNRDAPDIAAIRDGEVPFSVDHPEVGLE